MAAAALEMNVRRSPRLQNARCTFELVKFIYIDVDMGEPGEGRRKEMLWKNPLSPRGDDRIATHSVASHGDDEKPLSPTPTKFQEAALRKLLLNIMEINEPCSLEHLQESISILMNLHLILDATTVPLFSDQHDQYPESKSTQEININENAEVDVPSVNLNYPRLRTPLEQKVESQDDQFDVESHHEDEAISNPFYLVEQIRSSNNLYRARHTAASSELK
ncbi:hypothetical protein U1Q18_008532 [Sarracenia purpurea var. burkii]